MSNTKTKTETTKPKTKTGNRGVKSAPKPKAETSKPKVEPTPKPEPKSAPKPEPRLLSGVGTKKSGRLPIGEKSDIVVPIPAPDYTRSKLPIKTSKPRNLRRFAASAMLADWKLDNPGVKLHRAEVDHHTGNFNINDKPGVVADIDTKSRIATVRFDGKPYLFDLNQSGDGERLTDAIE